MFCSTRMFDSMRQMFPWKSFSCFDKKKFYKITSIDEQKGILPFSPQVKTLLFKVRIHLNLKSHLQDKGRQFSLRHYDKIRSHIFLRGSKNLLAKTNSHSTLYYKLVQAKNNSFPSVNISHLNVHNVLFNHRKRWTSRALL